VKTQENKVGRYITGDLEHKFWFGVQDTDDIFNYGSEETGIIRVVVFFDDLNKIENKVARFKQEFKRDFIISFDEFMDKIEKKGYLTSSADEETNTEEWNKMSVLASRIELGVKIIKELNKKQDNLYLECEC
jgi:hypothetical protein